MSLPLPTGYQAPSFAWHSKGPLWLGSPYVSSINISRSSFDRTLCPPLARCYPKKLVVPGGEGLQVLTCHAFVHTPPWTKLFIFCLPNEHYVISTLTFLINPFRTPAHIHLCTHILLGQSSVTVLITLDWIYLILSSLNRLQALWGQGP